LKQWCVELFLNFSTLIVFIHILSAMVWIGGMVALRFAVHFSLQAIDDPKIKLQTTLLNLKYFFNMVIVSIVLLFVTAFIMVQALELNSSIVYLKEGIWTVMTLVFIIVFIKRQKAHTFFNNNDFVNAKKELQPIAVYFIPLNIVLGLTALFLGRMI
jgi:uncharacterized membrane protein